MRNRILCLLAVSVAFGLASPSNGQIMSGGWAKFRGNIRNTALSAYIGPSQADLDWTFTTGAGVSSSPAVAADGTIYFVSQDRRLIALNSDGTELWTLNINSTSSSSPAIASNGTIYVGSDDYNLYAVNPNGSLKWKKNLGKAIKACPAIAADGTVYVGAMNSRFYALNKLDGSIRWSYDTDNPINSSAAIGSDGTIFFGSQDGYLHAVDTSGNRKWRYRTSYWVESSPAIGSDGTVYVGNSNGRLYRLASNGTYQGYYYIGSPVRSSPAIASDGTVYVGADNGCLYALTSTGALLWQYQTGDKVQSSPAIGADGIIYFGSYDGYLYALRPDGTLLWRHSLGTQVYSSPAIGPDGSVYVGSMDAKLYAFAKDKTPPSTPVVTDDGAETMSATQLHATWTASDPETGIAEFQYAIGTTQGATNVVGWTSVGMATEVTKTGLNLSEGTTYYFAVKAKNGMGLWSEVGVSDGIMRFATPPSTPVVTDDGAETMSATQLHATWTASDPETGIAEFQYAIGTSAGGTNVVGWTSVGTATEVTKTGLNLLEGVTYYFAVKAKNGIGLWGQVGVSDGIALVATPPSTPVVTDDGVNTTDATRLHATWTASDPETGIVEFQYAIGATQGGTDIVNWTSVGTAAEVTKTGLSLREGATYYFAVKAKNGIGLWSEVGVSDGIALVATPPSTPVVTDDGADTMDSTQLHATWTASDPETGIVEFQYAIGTTAGGTNVVGWTPVGTATEVAKAGLDLSEGVTYYFAVKAKNGIGLWSEVGVSDGIALFAVPAWPKFRYDTKNSGRSSSEGPKLGALLWRLDTAGWVESSPALSANGTTFIGSGDGCFYAIGSGGNLLWSYQTGGAIDSSPVVDSKGRIYFGSYDGYIYCLSLNGSLVWRYQTQEMIWSSPVLDSEGAVYVGCQDGRVYAVNPDGSSKWTRDISAAVWSSPALSDDGVLYFGANDGRIYAIYASTGNTKWSYQTGSAVDSSPSIGLDGTVYAGSGDGYFYALNSDGTLKWRYYSGWAVDSSAAIGPDGTIYVGIGHDWVYGLLYALRPDGTLKWWFDANGEVRSSPAIDTDGMIYFGSGDGNLYAVTGDGHLAWKYQTGLAILSSPAIGKDGRVCVGSFSGSVFTFKDSGISDPTAPTVPVVTDEGAATTSATTLSASWTASDPESGVAEYEYCIGTWPDTDDVVRWTSAGTATSIMRNDLSLSVGTAYYVSVRAGNAARLWSGVGSSNGIVVVGPASYVSIGQAKAMGEQSLVCITEKVVSAVFEDSFCIEDDDRSAGIGVLANGAALPSEGSRITVVGVVAKDGGANVLSLRTMESHGTAQSPGPVGMRNFAIAGGPVTPMQPAVAGAAGLNNVGLLVATWGKVTGVGAGYFLIDDGSGIRDASGIIGLRVRVSGTAPGRSVTYPQAGSYVKVVGAASMMWTGAGYQRVIRPRSASDVVTLAPAPP